MANMSTTTSVKAVMLALQILDIRFDDILARHGFASEDLDDPDRRVSSDLEMDLWDALAERSGDPAMGAALGAMPAPPMFDIVDYLISNSATFDASIDVFIRYQRLLYDGVGFSYEPVPGGKRLVLHPTPGQRVSRVAIEFAFSRIIAKGRATPLSVMMCGPLPSFVSIAATFAVPAVGDLGGALPCLRTINSVPIMPLNWVFAFRRPTWPTAR